MQKATDYSGQIEMLKQEIASLRNETSTIAKSAVPVPAQSDIRVPTHEEFMALGDGLDGWRALEELGQRALHGANF
jgi:hypothetical protein